MPARPERRIPPRKTTDAVGLTHLAYWRVKRGMTQETVAKHTGIPLATYRRLEKGEIENPRIGWLNNCGYVLHIDPRVLQSDYQDWVPLPKGPKKMPDDPEALHNEGRFVNVPDPARLGRRRRPRRTRTSKA